jgi:hypothetical protein
MDPIAIAKRGRRLLRKGLITHRQLVVLNCLLWCCRDRTGRITVSYTALCRLCHVARSTLSVALDALQALGCLSRIKRRVRVAWACGGTASRQATSSYLLHAPADTEFSGRTVIENDSIRVEQAPAAQHLAQAALTAVRARRLGWINERLLAGRSGHPAEAT